jgi:hypothetical protein
VLSLATMGEVIGERIRPALRWPTLRAAGFAHAPSTPQPLAWRAIALRAALLWLATRVALAVCGVTAVLFGFAAAGQPQAGHSIHTFIATWQRWDSEWYLPIAQRGYWSATQTAFFPLYPLLVHILIVLASGHVLVAGLLVSNLAALAAFIGLALLTVGEAGFDAAPHGVRIFAAYPLAFFLAAPYSDSLFVALAVFSLFCARRGHWGWAAVCACLASLTHLTAVVLIVPLAWEFVRQHDWWRGDGWRAQWRDPRGLAQLAALLGAAPAGILTYMAYLNARFGKPTTFLSAEHHFWDHQPMLPWQSLRLAAHTFRTAAPGSYDQMRMLVDYAPLALFALLTLCTVRRQPVSFTLYMLGLLYVCIASPIPVLQDVYASVGRYLLAAVPIFVLLARWSARRPWLETLLLGTGFMTQALLLAAYLAGRWII